MNNKQTIIITILIIILVIVCTAFCVYIVNNVNSKKKIQTKTIIKNVCQKNEEEVLEKSENIVFFGDSLTEYYPIEEIYGETSFVKSGVAGYKVQDLLDRMDTMLYRYNPTKVILLIGINDYYDDKSEENQKQIIKKIIKIVEKIKENRPKAKIYLESLYPINIRKKDLAEKEDNENIDTLNKKLKEYSKKNDIVYIEVNSKLKDGDGNLDERYSEDGIHLNKVGYAKVTRILVPYIYD